MNKEAILQQTEEYVRTKLSGEGSGHDWWHIYRVRQNAAFIGKHENSDLFVVQLAALLHDIADWKFHDGDDSIGPKVAGEIMKKHHVPKETIERVQEIIFEVGYKGAKVKTVPSSIEGKVVQDADRLDAIGAIGIARAFAFGGHLRRPLYNPAEKPVMHTSKEEYAKRAGNTITIFTRSFCY